MCLRRTCSYDARGGLRMTKSVFSIHIFNGECVRKFLNLCFKMSKSNKIPSFTMS